MCSLIEVIQDMVLQNEKPAKAIAEEVGKPHKTLLNELNEHNEGFKLGVSLLYPLMKACASIAPLEHLASLMGYRLLPLSQQEPDGKDMTEDCYQCLPALAAYTEAAQDDDVSLARTTELFQHALREMEDVLVHKQRMELTKEQLHKRRLRRHEQVMGVQ